MNKVLSGAACFLTGVAIVPLLAVAYVRYGAPPVAVTDRAFPMESSIAHIPLEARIDRERPAGAPIQATPENLLAGASIYHDRCAFCHGQPNLISAYGPRMYPPAPPLWESHRAGVVGVSDDPVGETFWKVRNGIRLSGMPAYASILSEMEMWQVSLLLSAAASPLPPEVSGVLSRQ